jgi:hypothetical protein
VLLGNRKACANRACGVDATSGGVSFKISQLVSPGIGLRDAQSCSLVFIAFLNRSPGVSFPNQSADNDPLVRVSASAPIKVAKDGPDLNRLLRDRLRISNTPANLFQRSLKTSLRWRHVKSKAAAPLPQHSVD